MLAGAMKHIKCFYKAPVCLVWDSYCGGEGELAVVGERSVFVVLLPGWTWQPVDEG